MPGGHAAAKMIGPHFSRAIGPSGRPGRRGRRLFCGLSPTRLVLGVCMSIMVLLMVRMPGDYRDDAEDGAVGDDSEGMLPPGLQDNLLGAEASQPQSGHTLRKRRRKPPADLSPQPYRPGGRLSMFKSNSAVEAIAYQKKIRQTARNAMGFHAHPKPPSSAKISAAMKESQKEKEKSAAKAKAGLPLGTNIDQLVQDVYYPPRDMDGVAWDEWNQSVAHRYSKDVLWDCSGPARDIDLQEKPECSYVFGCGSEVPPQEESKVVMEHADYIERYSEAIRYMHMPMLERLRNGRILSVWQAAPLIGFDIEEHGRLAIEGTDLQHLRMSVSHNKDGTAWSTPKKIDIPQTAALWSPVPHVDKSGKLWLFYSESVGCRKTTMCHPCVAKIGHPCKWDRPWSHERCHTQNPTQWVPGGSIRVITSDNPTSPKPIWSKPRLLLSAKSFGGIPKVICNKLIVLRTGEWVLPYWREQTESTVVDGTCIPVNRTDTFELKTIIDGKEKTKKIVWPPGTDCPPEQPSACNTGAREYSGVLLSSDEGKTWKARGRLMVPSSHLIEGTVAELRNGTIMMIMRTQVGCLYQSLSSDKGETWSLPRPIDVPNPNSKVHLLRLQPEGHLLLAFNNHKKSLRHCRTCRSKMHLAMSIDDGENWRHIVSLDDELSSSMIQIHYPCLLQVEGAGSKVLVTYSRFYLGKTMGLTSPDQGVAVIKLNLDGVLSNLEEIFSASSANSGRPVFVEADTDAVGDGVVGDAGVEDIMPEGDK